MDFIKKVLLARLKERSTWVGITAMVGALGVHMEPALMEQIIAFGSAAVGLILAIWPDVKPVVEVK